MFVKDLKTSSEKVLLVVTLRNTSDIEVDINFRVYIFCMYTYTYCPSNAQKLPLFMPVQDELGQLFT